MILLVKMHEPHVFFDQHPSSRAKVSIPQLGSPKFLNTDFAPPCIRNDEVLFYSIIKYNKHNQCAGLLRTALVLGQINLGPSLHKII